MKIIVSLFLIVFSLFILKAQCPTGTLTINSQSQIDQFIIDYPNCQEINASIRILNAPSVTNLNGFQNLTSINGLLEIYNCSNLTDITGLSNLERINDDFRLDSTGVTMIENNFPKLMHIAGKLHIDNENLIKIDDFKNLVNCNLVEIIGNINLNQLMGFDNLDNSTVRIESNNIEFIDAFQNVSKMQRLNISNNTDIFLNISPLYNLLEISSSLSLNMRSHSLDWLPNLTSINFGLSINIFELNDISGLSNLNCINGLIYITNSNLNSLTGLQNINSESITSINLLNNSNLSSCSLPNICSFISQGGFTTLINNEQGCNSVEEILESCSMSIDSHELNSKINIYPNPVKNDLNISLKDNSLKVNKISLYDLSGKLVNEFENQSKLNLSFYPSGNYVIVLDTDKGFISKKITIAK
ncbi:T9SS type A sorting domain-containing protein [Moheibacter sediminis]|uniref:Por secretion system C-terminal sorting domain-containing protein n=1 Tax=Moheibacter sediminis TaxID=1434700 RepID=A0A1W2BPU9_9FLAO|nr:T9SS type A sorting domain-containing protein [Moheibacter sediminis]SMC74881.1 Por secretion system C-terminal sorting domain-containing protein [Moheibacter sediminis]